MQSQTLDWKTGQKINGKYFKRNARFYEVKISHDSVPERKNTLYAIYTQ